jgi:hypothetical protein
VCTRPDEDHDGRVAWENLFNCLHLVEPVHGTYGSSGAALSQKAGAGAQATCGGTGATLSREVGVGAAGARGSPRAAPSQEAGVGAMGARGAPGAALSREVGAGAAGTRSGLGAALPFVLTWSLYAGVSDPQGTDSGPWAHLGRRYKPAGGANILSHVAFLSLVRWDVAMFSAPSGTVTRCSYAWVIIAQRKSRVLRQL